MICVDREPVSAFRGRWSAPRTLRLNRGEPYPLIFTRGYTNGLQRQSANCKTNLEITGLSAMGQLKVSAKETIPDYRSASQMNSNNQFESGKISQRTFDSAQPAPERKSFTRSVQQGNGSPNDTRQPAVREKAQGVTTTALTGPKVASYLAQNKDSALKLFAPAACGEEPLVVPGFYHLLVGRRPMCTPWRRAAL